MVKFTNIKQIYIGNILEAFFSSYTHLPEKERDYWTMYDACDNNRSLLYGGDNKVLVTPIAIDRTQMDYLAHLAGWKNVHNISPQKYSNSICWDLVNDPALNKEFKAVLEQNPNVELIPYRHTPEFYRLLDYLDKSNFKVSLPETVNKENKFIELYFHSKRGFRHLWEIVKNRESRISIPFGYMTSGKSECKEAAFWFKNKDKDFVIKYNRGVQGIGVLILSAKDFDSDWKRFSAQIDTLITDEIWSEDIIVVEERIAINKSILGGSPNVEMRVAHDGTVHREYACEQVLQEDGKTFMGVGMNKEVDVSPHIEEAYRAAENIGKYLSDLGYRGNFDMDLVISKENKVFAIEANLRRTGGTHIHEFCKEVLGNNYSQNYYVMSYEIKIENKDRWDSTKIETVLKSLLFDKGKMAGIIVVNKELVNLGLVSLLAIEKSRLGIDTLIKASRNAILKKLATQ